VINAEGCLQTTCKQVFFNVGINNLEKGITIYPNPTEDLLYISSKEPFLNAAFTLSDAQGKILLQRTCTGRECTINLKSFPPGTYTLSIQQEGLILKKAVVRL
jgi:hypothetical protein